jgi:uncharacterized protein (TIGR03790 family)
MAAFAALLIMAAGLHAQGLAPDRLGILYNLDEPSSKSVALYYAARRGIPLANTAGVSLGSANVISPDSFGEIRIRALNALPAKVQSLALVWSRPFAVGCMSVTTAFAAGYRADFCVPGCAATAPNPLFDTNGWLPADTVGWWPAMLIPVDDPTVARELIDRGVAADSTHPPGILYLVHTTDERRNIRAATYDQVESALSKRVKIVDMAASSTHELPDAIAYFTGSAHVDELQHIRFRAGAVADHLTSTGGVLFGGNQMSAMAWIKQGATASYGSVTEPCNGPQKFPNIEVLLRHYLDGDSILEAYWKSVAMPGQGLFIGEPLARPYAPKH